MKKRPITIVREYSPEPMSAEQLEAILRLVAKLIAAEVLASRDRPAPDSQPPTS